MNTVAWRMARVALLGTGLTALAVLVWRNDPTSLLDSVRQLSWRLLIIVAFPFALVNLLDTLGWRFAFRRDGVPIRTLFSARLAGEAFNLTTPTASIGGEAVKAWLVRRHVGYEESFPSVIVAKTTITIAQGLLLVVGLSFAWLLLPHDSALLRVMAWLLVLEVLAVAVFVVAQLRGVIGGGGRLMAKLSMSPGPERQAVMDGMDQALRSLYVERGKSVVESVWWHFAGFAIGTLEIYLVVQLLGVPISLPVAFAIGALGTADKFFTFMVPASLGALEGGNVAIFTAFGLGGAVGLTYTLVRRLREIVWVAAGFLASHWVSLQSVPPADRE